MSKFKIGDRVVVVVARHNGYAKYGQVGTVLEDSPGPWIVFDEPTGYAGDRYIKGWRDDHMDCINEDSLEPYKDPAMNNPHKWHKEIVAFAEGRAIQWRWHIGSTWYDQVIDGRFPDFNSPEHEFRIKPKTLRYRVALFMPPSGSAYSVTANDESFRAVLEGHPNFSRWLTDWQEVEVES